MALINCPECGKEISDRAPHCIYCGCPIDISIKDDNVNNTANAKNETIISRKHTTYKNGASSKKPFLIIGSIFFAIALLIGCIILKMTISNGNVNKSNDTPKTYSSTSSTSKTISNSSYSLDSLNDGETWESALEITDIYYGQESSRLVYKASVKNNGKKTYKYIKVKGAFLDRNGKTVDTDWTYAVGSEGLRPGEKSSFACQYQYFQIS